MTDDNTHTGYRDGDIVFYKDDAGHVYDAALVEMEGDVPFILYFCPFYGRVRKVLDTVRFNFAVYRYVGRKDDTKDDVIVAKEAVMWFKRWNKYRYSTNFWILLSRIPVIRHWIKTTSDRSKVFADRGFTTSTAIAWAFECAGVDLVPNRSPDLTSVGDLARCALLRRVG
jgi:hypothetical protein